MANVAPAEQTSSVPSIQVGDLVALVASLIILIAYAVLPLRSDGPSTGLSFIDSGTTFPVLTLVVGMVGLVTSIVNVSALRDKAARWWYAGLGVLGLVFLFDNMLRGKAALDSGGLLAMVGSFVLVAQVVVPRTGSASDVRSSDILLGLLRVLLATLWFTQLLWKLPWNNYGCPAGALVPAANTSGLCDWIGQEIQSPRWPLYKSFLNNVITPNLGWMAFFIVAGEAFVAFSLTFGVFTRLGALVGVAMGINLFIGLTAVPHEWDWTYLMLPMLNAAFIAIGGRVIGIDALLSPRFKKMEDGGNPLGRILGWFV